jgi:monoamine oxidase
MSEVRSVIVVGAGAAGLATAHDLSRAGCEVLVIEARERIGGRVFTLNDPKFPAPIELGAEFVHGKSPTLRISNDTKSAAVTGISTTAVSAGLMISGNTSSSCRIV